MTVPRCAILWYLSVPVAKMGCRDGKSRMHIKIGPGETREIVNRGNHICKRLVVILYPLGVDPTGART